MSRYGFLKIRERLSGGFFPGFIEDVLKAYDDLSEMGPAPNIVEALDLVGSEEKDLAKFHILSEILELTYRCDGKDRVMKLDLVNRLFNLIRDEFQGRDARIGAEHMSRKEFKKRVTEIINENYERRS